MSLKQGGNAWHECWGRKCQSVEPGGEQLWLPVNAVLWGSFVALNPATNVSVIDTISHAEVVWYMRWNDCYMQWSWKDKVVVAYFKGAQLKPQKPCVRMFGAPVDLNVILSRVLKSCIAIWANVFNVISVLLRNASPCGCIVWGVGLSSLDC